MGGRGSDAEQETHSGNHPLCRLLLGLEVEGPHIGGASHPGLVHRTLIHVLGLLLLHQDGLDEHHGHTWGEILETGLLDEAGVDVPAGSLHEQAVDVGPLSRGAGEIVTALLGHVALETHLVQRPLVLAGHGLHDGREEGLRVEEAREPDAAGHGKVGDPGLELMDAHEEVSVPGGQIVHGGVGTFGPALGDAVKEEGRLQSLHVRSDGQFTLQVEVVLTV